MKATTIYLVRHGQTSANASVPPILQGKGADYALNETGLAQAVAVAQAFSDVQLSALYSSPLLRARQTAQPLADQHGLAVSTIDRLHEVDVGEWEGWSWDEVIARDPHRYAKVISHGGDRPYPGGESYVDVADRVVPILQDLAVKHVGESIAIIAHRVVNRCAIARLMGLDIRRAKDLPQDNGAINVLRGDAKGVKLVTLNAVTHLERLSEAT